MLPEEVEEYKKNLAIYQTSLMKMGLKMNYSDSFRKLIMISGRSNIARQAVLARNKAMDIALNSKSKIEELREILSEYKGRKTIIFTQHNKLVCAHSQVFETGQVESITTSPQFVTIETLYDVLCRSFFLVYPIKREDS